MQFSGLALGEKSWEILAVLVGPGSICDHSCSRGTDWLLCTKLWVWVEGFPLKPHEMLPAGKSFWEKKRETLRTGQNEKQNYIHRPHKITIFKKYILMLGLAKINRLSF